LLLEHAIPKRLRWAGWDRALVTPDSKSRVAVFRRHPSGLLPEECLKELDLPKMLRTPEPGKFYNNVDAAEEK
jgi:hypothetical protein